MIIFKIRSGNSSEFPLQSEDKVRGCKAPDLILFEEKKSAESLVFTGFFALFVLADPLLHERV